MLETEDGKVTENIWKELCRYSITEQYNTKNSNCSLNF